MLELGDTDLIMVVFLLSSAAKASRSGGNFAVADPARTRTAAAFLKSMVKARKTNETYQGM